jgi:pimeloyl-ACP methyl ester carboxylesterase
VPHDDGVGPHGVKRHRRVEQGLALAHRGGGDVHVDHVGAQPLGCDLEAGPRACRILEEQVYDRPPGEHVAAFVDGPVLVDVAFGKVEQARNGFGRKTPCVKLSEEESKQVEGFFAMMDSNFSGTAEVYTKENLFPKSADTSIVNRVVNDIKMNDPVIAIKVLRSLFDVSQKERDLMQQLKHTLYLVNSDGDTTHIDSLKKYCKASAEVVYVHGTGHYPMIEKPAEFNAALEKVFALMGKK